MTDQFVELQKEVAQLRAEVTRLTEELTVRTGHLVQRTNELAEVTKLHNALATTSSLRIGQLAEERDALLPLIKDLSEESDASINDSAIGWNYRRHARRIMGERAAALRGDDNA